MRPRSPPGSKPLREGLHFYGIEDYTQALHRWEIASSLDNLEAMIRAADLYYEGKNRLPRDPSKALMLYKKAAYQFHDTLAQYKIGLMYYLGDGVQQSFENAYTYFELAAREGWFSAELALAHLFYTGQGVRKDFNKAFHWYSKYDDRPECQLGIAKLYHHGHKDFLQDSAKALTWYRRAATRGLPEAQYCLGNIYNHGSLGMEKNYSKAMDWYSMADKHNHVDSTVSIGLLHYYGKGVKADMDLAQMFFKKALRIDKEHPLANFYYANLCVTENPHDNAIKYFIRAANSHHGDAAFTVGKFYEFGMGVEKDTEKAIGWYKKAIADSTTTFYAQIALNKLLASKNSKAIVSSNVSTASDVATSSKTTPDVIKSNQSNTLQKQYERLKESYESVKKKRIKLDHDYIELKQKFDSKESERNKLEQEYNELKQKFESSESEKAKLVQESKEKDEQIRLLTIEKAKMQKFQMQLVLDMADEKKSAKRQRDSIEF